MSSGSVMLLSEMRSNVEGGKHGCVASVECHGDVWLFETPALDMTCVVKCGEWYVYPNKSSSDKTEEMSGWGE